jgi:hypothetical protein
MYSDGGVVSREFLIRILKEHGVTVAAQKDSSVGHLVIAKGDTLEVRVIPDMVCRQMVRAFSMKFNIPMHLFYN